ncbi:protein SCO1 homolog 2, mitochondrial isoform X2 [Tanacetum coccineum]
MYSNYPEFTQLGQCKNDGCSSRNGPVIGGPFKLIDPNGKLATDKDHKGNWTLLQFGYTSSPDVGSFQLASIYQIALLISNIVGNLGVQVEERATYGVARLWCNPEFDVAKAGRKRFMIFADKSVLKVHIPEVLPDVVKEECLILVTTNVNEETGTIEIKQETVKEVCEVTNSENAATKESQHQHSQKKKTIENEENNDDKVSLDEVGYDEGVKHAMQISVELGYEIISLLDGVSLHEYASSGLKPTCENDVLCRK